MIGRWRLANGYYANVTDQDDTHWLGIVEIRIGMDWYEIPTYWDMQGDSIRPEFNLVQRRRGDEVFGGQA